MKRIHTRTDARRDILSVVVVALGLAVAGPADAHLSLIRQGGETRGARESGDAYGASLAIGDFDGDGYNDLAAGSPHEKLGEDPGTRLHGIVTVNYGSLLGLTHVDPELLQPLSSSLFDINQRFGSTLAAGDFNNDTFDDLAVAAPWIDAFDGTSDVGAVYIFEGTPSGLSTTYSVELVGDLTLDELFGDALASGDFDADGFIDLAVGAPGADVERGKVSIFYGSGGGLSMGNPRNLVYEQSSWTFFEQTDVGFGTVLAAGHFIGDEADDLIVGAPRFGINFANQGQIFIAEGNDVGGLEPDPSETKSALSFGGAVSGGKFFGYAIAIGHLTDVPGGYGTVAIGEPGRTGSDGSADAGRVYVVQGSTNALIGDVTILDQSDAVCENGSCVPEAGDYFGSALAIGRLTVGLYDDLAIASSREDIWDEGVNHVDAGIVNVLYGSDQPIGSAGGRVFSCKNLDYDTFDSTYLGVLAFGRVDWNATGRQSLLIGSPFFDDGSGIVYVVSPWRQVYDYDAKSAISRDCEGSIIYSRRPFEELQIASTTKIMTTLLACEAIQGGQVDSSLVYTIPDWVAGYIGGSSANLFYGEQTRLIDLMRMCMTVSGNDAAYAIADVITGGNATWQGSFGTVPEFVDAMNARAAQIGMSDSYFTNPAGLDIRDDQGVLPYSTSLDMSDLGRVAMQNDLFRSIVSPSAWTVTRWIGGTPISMIYNNGFVQAVKQAFTTGNGVKGGSTPAADVTGVYSGTDNAGDVVAVSLGTPGGQPLFGPAGGLLAIGQSQCSESTPFSPGDFEVETPIFPQLPFLSLSQIPAIPGTPIGGATDFTSENPITEPIYVELLSETDPADYDVRLRATSHTELPAGASTTVGFTGALGMSEGVNILVRSDGPLFVEVVGTGGTQIIACAQCVDSLLTWPAVSAPQTSMSTEIVNLGSSPVSLKIVEKGYVFAAETSSALDFRVELTRLGVPVQTNLDVIVEGASPGATGETAYLVVRSANGLVDVASDSNALPSAGAGLGRVTAHPSPFASRTALSFTLDTGDPADVRVYDVAGRLVRRTVSRAEVAGPRRLVWDGRTDRGGSAPGGVYFVEVHANGRKVARGRLVKVR